MKHMKRLLLFWVVIVSIFSIALTGCTNNSTTETGTTVTPADQNTSIVKVTEANTALENQDITSANAKFLEAYTADPTNKDANFGLAVTESIMIGDDPDLVAVLKKFDPAYLPATTTIYPKAKSLSAAAPLRAGAIDPMSLFNALKAKLPQNKPTYFQKAKRAFAAATSTDAPPTVSEVQAAIDKILPKLTNAIAKLRYVEGKDYTFTITTKMSGDNKTIVLDDGEFYAVDALLSGVQSILNLMTAYNLEINFDTLSYDPLSIVNGQSATFLTLKSTGAAKMNAALTGLQEATDKANKCYNFVFNEWGYTAAGDYLTPTKTVTDNGLQWHETGYPESFMKADDSNIKNLFSALKMVTSGQVTVTETIANGTSTNTLSDGVTTITLDTYQTMDPAATNTLVFNATKFFTSPLTKNNLPPLSYNTPIDITKSQQMGYPVSSQVDMYGNPVEIEIIVGKVPDPTFNGIFPNNYPGYQPQ